MINDFKKDDHLSSLFEEKPLIRNISFEMDKNKYYYLDNKGSNYICNMYGDNRPKFKYKISGFINGSQRKVIKNSKSLSDILISNRYKFSNQTENEKIYLPSLRKFEGYTQFPRPICSPFGNIPYYEMDKNSKLKLKLKSEKSLDNEDNKKLFKKDEENKGLSYITSNIKMAIDSIETSKDDSNNNKNSKKDKNLLLKLIKNTCNEINNTPNLPNNLRNNNHTLKALIHLKKKLLNNNETNMINGRKLKEPNTFIINEYKIINKKLFRDYKSTNNFLDQHKNLVKSFSHFNLQLSQMMNKNKSDNSKINSGRILLSKISLNNINQKPINLTEKVFNNDLNATSNNDLNKNEDNLKQNLLKIPKTRNKLLSSETKTNFSYSQSDRRINLMHFNYDCQETKESLLSKPQNNLFSSVKPNSKDNTKEENQSFISEKYHIFTFNRKINFRKNLERYSQSERRLLEGYKKDEPKKPKLFNTKEEDQPKYKDFSEIYKKELETLEKCNPTLFDLQKKIEKKETEKLKKRKDFQKISEKYRIKGKGAKINKKVTEK